MLQKLMLLLSVAVIATGVMTGCITTGDVKDEMSNNPDQSVYDIPDDYDSHNGDFE